MIKKQEEKQNMSWQAEFETEEFETEEFETEEFETEEFETEEFEIEEFEPFFEEEFEEESWRNKEENSYLSLEDAMILCKRNFGKVNVEFLKAKTGLSWTDFVGKVKGSVFQDPEIFHETKDTEAGWLFREQYLRMPISIKLQTAERLDRIYHRFSENIDALRTACNAGRVTEDIYMSFDSPWIGLDVKKKFIAWLLDLKSEPEITYNNITGKTYISIADKERLKNSVKNNYVYGTYRMSAVNIMQDTLNAKTVKVYDTIWKSKWEEERILNEAETQLAQQKQQAILDAFLEWVSAQKDLEERLSELYSQKFAAVVSKQYDSRVFSGEGLNEEITLYEHQKVAIVRNVLTDTGLVAHDVGTGKTRILICSAHERLRMGISRKVLLVVPNNVLGDFIKEQELLYPNQSYLVFTPKDFEPKVYDMTLQKIADAQNIVIFMAHSSFNKLGVSYEYNVKMLDEQLKKINEALSNVKKYTSEYYGLETMRKKALKEKEELLELKIEKYHFGLSFDHLGVDCLMIDECHNYKNISIMTKTDGVVGMHTAGSKKCNELLKKCRFLQENDGSIFFATGTPLTNSLSDLFVLQTYLQPNELKSLGIDWFDRWISTFAERETNFEVSVDPGKYQIKTRFTRFHNLPELMSLFAEICDFYHASEKDMELPVCEGYQDVLVPQNERQKSYYRNISNRADAIHAHTVSRREDNMLKVTHDGLLCGLDDRLVKTNLEIPFENVMRKVDACADKLIKEYWADLKSTHVVFCDFSTPKDRFNIYDELKDILIQNDIPEYEIAFIHDATTEAKRKKLFSDFNDGKIRILVGSTLKLGTGTNIQKRLKSLHHIDVPWRPSDMVQREGRIRRQGNMYSHINIYRYITEKSFDAYSWQLLENKQKFISDFLSGSMSQFHRDDSDMDELVLSYSELKALAIGNPLIKERVEVANQMERAKISRNQRRKQMENLQEIVHRTPELLEKCNKLMEQFKQDDLYYKKMKQIIPMDEREALGLDLEYALQSNVMFEKERLFDWYQGFEIVLPAYMTEEHPYVTLRRKSSSYYVSMGRSKIIGYSRKLDYCLEHLKDRILEQENKKEDLLKQRAIALDDLEEGNPYGAQVEALIKRLAEIDDSLSKCC